MDQHCVESTPDVTALDGLQTRARSSAWRWGWGTVGGRVGGRWGEVQSVKKTSFTNKSSNPSNCDMLEFANQQSCRFHFPTYFTAIKQIRQNAKRTLPSNMYYKSILKQKLWTGRSGDEAPLESRKVWAAAGSPMVGKNLKALTWGGSP